MSMKPIKITKFCTISEELNRLELENKLIKQEVVQLTEEISFLSSKLTSCKVVYI